MGKVVTGMTIRVGEASGAEKIGVVFTGDTDRDLGEHTCIGVETGASAGITEVCIISATFNEGMDASGDFEVTICCKERTCATDTGLLTEAGNTSIGLLGESILAIEIALSLYFYR